MTDMLLIGIPFLLGIALAIVVFQYDTICVRFFRIPSTTRSADEIANLLASAKARFPRVERSVLDIEGQACEYSPAEAKSVQEHCRTAVIVRYWLLHRYKRSLGYGRTAAAVAAIQCFALGSIGLAHPGTTAEWAALATRASVITLALFLVVTMTFREKREFDEDCGSVMAQLR